MNVLTKALQKLMPAAKPGRVTFGLRRYEAAVADRLTASWTTTSVNPNEEIRDSLEQLRARSRDLAQNNEYAKHFFSMLTSNVVGPNGVGFQSQARRVDGSLDQMDNDTIERGMMEWSKVGQCDVTRRLSRPMLERLFVDTVSRDGEFLARKVSGYANDYRYALQCVDPVLLDHTYNQEPRDGLGRIVMGVELDDWWAPQAYWLLTSYPNAGVYSSVMRSANPERIRIPASEMIHAFIPTHAQQVRGVPWIHAAMRALRDLGGYREAAIVASRVGAAKNPVIQTPDGTFLADGADSVGNGVLAAGEPGQPWVLPEGSSIAGWDPDYPHQQFGEFNKAMLRGLAGAMGVSYFNLNNDLESVNLSSARIGQQNERDMYKSVQQFMLDTFHGNWFPEWLGAAIPVMGLPMSRYDKFNAPSWRPRSWPSPDPLKDAQTQSLLLSMNLMSPQKAIRDMGMDPDEVLREIEQWHERLDAAGIPVTHLSNVVPEVDTDESQESEIILPEQA